MKKFSQFNVQPLTKIFEGDKIKMAKILNRSIVVHDFKLEDSKCFRDRGNGKCLYLQISIGEVKHIIFTSSCGLIEVIQQIPADGFPFETTIIQEGERFLFT
jgi:hypothetical protein